MARMIPPQAPEGSENEFLVYEILKDCPATDSWIVIHQLDLSKHATQVSGEADMIICVPGEGIAFLEVKGYAEFRDGQWFYGGSTVPGKSPFKQARGAMYSVKDWLEEEQFPFWHLPMVSGAILAQTRWTIEIPDAREEELIDCSSVNPRAPELLRDAILRLIRNARSLLAGKGKPLTFTEGDPDEELISRFVRLLRPNFHPPHSQINLIWSRVARFTEEQLAALDECKSCAQVVFKGLAGTGKTVLATELSLNEAQRNNKVLFICFNQLARERAKSVMGDTSGVVVKGGVELAFDLIRKFDGTPAAKDLSRAVNSGAVPFRRIVERAAALAAGNPGVGSYDLLIVDEGQDVMSPEFLEIMGAYLQGGLTHGRWVLFLDQNQWIYGGTRLSIKTFLEKFPASRLRQLQANCRNTESIAMFANLHGALTEPDNYDRLLVKHRSEETHPRPSFRFYSDDEDQDKMVASHLFALINSGLPPQEIVVISASKEGSCASRLHSNAFKSLLTPFGFDEADKIRFETIHRFKGLEAYCVVLTDVEELPAKSSGKPIRELMYTAITRAVFRLDCFANIRLANELIGV